MNDETYQGGFVIVWTVYDRNKCFPCYNFVHIKVISSDVFGFFSFDKWIDRGDILFKMYH